MSKQLDKAIMYAIMVIVALALIFVTQARPVLHLYEDGSAVIGIGLCLPGGLCNESEK